MPRPKRPRRIFAEPIADEFGPRGIRSDNQIFLSLEEFEAIRLIDYEGMDQSGAAEIMNVSRHTVGRVLKSARRKLAQSIVEALPMKVAGGCYKIHPGRGRNGTRGGRPPMGPGKGRRRGPGRGRR